MVPLLAAVLVTAGAATPATAQASAWREHFAAGQEAMRSGDSPRYAREMEAALDGLDPRALNRPFVQYHAARAHALQGDGAGAARWLEVMLDEAIEGLMATFAPYDPAFDDVIDHPAVRAALARPASMTLAHRSLGGSVHLIEGAGSNVLASVGPDGVLLVDTGYEAALPALRRVLREIAGAPGPDVVILTHPHEDHWGGTEGLAAEALVIAHAGTAEAMDEPYTFLDGVVVPTRSAEARPDRTVSDTVFVFNGEPVRILGVEAHTGADVAVHFTRSGVVHLGDAFLGAEPMMFPGGADPDGFLDRFETFLRELPPGTVVVGGHDPPTGVAPVLEQIDQTRACFAFARDAVGRGLSLEATTEAAPDRWSPGWVGFCYRVASAEG